MNILKVTMQIGLEIVSPLSDEDAAKARAADLNGPEMKKLMDEAKAEVLAEFTKDGARITSFEAAVSLHEV